MVTDEQVKRLWRALSSGKTLAQSADKAGMDEKTARKYRRLGRLPSEVAPERTWRTRPDPFAEIWPEVHAQLQEAPGLEAKTLFAWLQGKYPTKFDDSQLRSFQRGVKRWRATAGPAKEVFFSQVHHPGRLCASDFNVADRKSPIGNPKLEYLRDHAEGIFAEVLGMVERWKAAGMPLDEDVRHPFSLWAKTVGGILKANHFRDFLANYGQRRTADDPVREALGILGVEWATDDPNTGWERSEVWAQRMGVLGLTKKLIPQGDQGSPAGRSRGAGSVLSTHRDETFSVETEAEKVVVRLERRRKHSKGGDKKVHNYYRFFVVDRKPIGGEEEEGD